MSVGFVIRPLQPSTEVKGLKGIFIGIILCNLGQLLLRLIMNITGRTYVFSDMVRMLVKPNFGTKI